MSHLESRGRHSQREKLSATGKNMTKVRMYIVYNILIYLLKMCALCTVLLKSWDIKI